MNNLVVLVTAALFSITVAQKEPPTLTRGQRNQPASIVNISPRVITRTQNDDGSTTYNLLLITDMDAHSRAEEWKWRAISRKAKLTLSANKKEIKLDWIEGSDVNLTTGFNFKGRGMELSDLSEFNGHLISPDDKTGLLYEIKKDKAIPWVFLNSGPGNTTKGMKAEWLTIKDNLLYAGGHGTEYLNSRGEVANDDAMWIKTITKTGKVTSHYWKNVYNTIRNTAQFPAPGYLTHEAVQWSKAREMWYFLPRKASKTPFVEEEDETKGTNLLIMGPEDLESVDVVYIGNRTVEHPERGFSAFDFIPDTEDELILAIKSKEVTGSEPESFITVFNVHGKVLMEDQQIAGNYKFEAVYFV
ncbi:hypothetical protein RB195_003149 [Necator americanus]|uniref:Apyrase n=1 Tax=Necator americanus TaxID=51031 RepID=A0ABR1DM83_NECAM